MVTTTDRGQTAKRHKAEPISKEQQELIRKYMNDPNMQRTRLARRAGVSLSVVYRYIRKFGGTVGQKDTRDKDVEEFVNNYNVQCHPLYYDERGAFHVERRLGCMACPLKSGKGLEDFKKHPKLVRAWLRNLQASWINHTDNPTKTMGYFENIYEQFYFHLFCESLAEFNGRKSGMFGKRDFKKEMEEYFGISLDNL